MVAGCGQDEAADQEGQVRPEISDRAFGQEVASCRQGKEHERNKKDRRIGPLAGLVLVIIAGVNANGGTLYRYPVTLRLIK